MDTPFPTSNQETYVPVDGNVTRIFDSETHWKMLTSRDEDSVVLKAHLLLEEFLNIWCSQIPETDNFSVGKSARSKPSGFKDKLTAARNRGLDPVYINVLDEFNKIRNSYAHERKYTLEQSKFDALKNMVNALPSEVLVKPCEQSCVFVPGQDQFGHPLHLQYEWASTDAIKRMLIIIEQLIFKFALWMQTEFNRREISYTLIVWPPQGNCSNTSP
jgi:hypothetical protein